jgi:hypothetical protein
MSGREHRPLLVTVKIACGPPIHRITVGEAIPPSSCQRKGADRSAIKYSVCYVDEEAGLRTAYGGYEP